MQDNNKCCSWQRPWRHEGAQEPPAEGQGGLGQGGAYPGNMFSSADSKSDLMHMLLSNSQQTWFVCTSFCLSPENTHFEAVPHISSVVACRQLSTLLQAKQSPALAHRGLPHQTSYAPQWPSAPRQERPPPARRSRASPALCPTSIFLCRDTRLLDDELWNVGVDAVLQWYSDSVSCGRCQWYML